MTIIHINQPRFLPTLNYFQRMLIADVFVYLDTCKFSKQDWENRNRIKTAAGPRWLTVPVKKAPEDTPLCEIEIDNSHGWWHPMLATIKSAYGRAPHFGEFYPQIAHLLGEWRCLVHLNFRLMEVFMNAWGLVGECTHYRASEMDLAQTGDARNLEICQKIGATKYLSGAEGRNYNDRAMWAAAGIPIEYHDYAPVEYPQQFGPFLPWMSALDLLMNCGADGRRYLEMGIEGKSA